jgi:predicted O-methyltransferase YrrM
MMTQIPTALSVVELAVLAEFAEGRDVLELGAQWGASTIHLARVARRVVSVDWHRGDPDAGWEWTGAQYLQNLHDAKVLDRIIPIVGPFDDVLRWLLADRDFDLVFLDGAHDAESVERDLRNILLYLDAGRILCHDYGRFGVAEGIEAAGFEVVNQWETLAEVKRGRPN